MVDREKQAGNAPLVHRNSHGPHERSTQAAPVREKSPLTHLSEPIDDRPGSSSNASRSSRFIEKLDSSSDEETHQPVVERPVSKLPPKACDQAIQVSEVDPRFEAEPSKDRPVKTCQPDGTCCCATMHLPAVALIPCSCLSVAVELTVLK